MAKPRTPLAKLADAGQDTLRLTRPAFLVVSALATVVTVARVFLLARNIDVFVLVLLHVSLSTLVGVFLSSGAAIAIPILLWAAVQAFVPHASGKEASPSSKGRAPVAHPVGRVWKWVNRVYVIGVASALLAIAMCVPVFPHEKFCYTPLEVTESGAACSKVQVIASESDGYWILWRDEGWAGGAIIYFVDRDRVVSRQVAPDDYETIVVPPP